MCMGELDFLACSASICEWLMEKSDNDDIIDSREKRDAVDPSAALSNAVVACWNVACGNKS